MVAKQASVLERHNSRIFASRLTTEKNMPRQYTSEGKVLIEHKTMKRRNGKKTGKECNTRKGENDMQEENHLWKSKQA